MHKHLWTCDGCQKQATTEISRRDPPADWCTVEIYSDNEDAEPELRLYCGAICASANLLPKAAGEGSA